MEKEARNKFIEGMETMDYYDEELLEARRELKRKKHTTIETGIYAGDTLIRFVHEGRQ